MAVKMYDLIIFGATGYTGKNVVQYVARSAKELGDIKWAVSGRDESNLKKVLGEVPTDHKYADAGVIICDVKDELSLLEMAGKGKVVLNCVGPPYSFNGEAVVKACLAKGTHHIDISDEPLFLETMQLRYHKEAKEKGVYVIGACGFDSIPSDVGASLVHKAMEGPVNTIETYLKLGPGNKSKGPFVNFASWLSAIHGSANAHELQGIRKQLYPERLLRMQPHQKDRGQLHKSEEVGIEGQWCLNQLSTDRSVMLRTERYRYEGERKRRSQIQTFLQCSSLFMSIYAICFGAIFGLLVSSKFGRFLLVKFHGFFSRGGVTNAGPLKERVEGSFFEMKIKGLGWKDLDDNADDIIKDSYNREVTVIVKGRSVGEYMVQSGITILKEIKLIPGDGGVLTPGYAFANTTIVERLRNKGCTFDVSVKDL